MAVIDSKKLLPAGQPGSSIVKSQAPFLVPAENISFKKSAIISTNLLKPVDEKEFEKKESGKEIVKIKKKVISIADILKNTFFIRKRNDERKRKEKEKLRAKKREESLEKKPGEKAKKDIPGLSLPGASIFERIQRFFLFTLAGYLINKYSEYLPKLLEFGKLIGPTLKFIESFGKNIINGVISFIDFGYKTYDTIRDSIKKIGGENAQKTFDDFSKNLNIVLNGAIIAATIALSTAPKTPRGRLGKMSGGKPSTSLKNAKLASYLKRVPQTKLIEKRYGNDAARMYEARKSQGASTNRARADVLKRFKPLTERYGAQRGLAGGTGKGAIFSRGLGKAANRASLKVLGKAGTKIAKGIFGRVPIIGGLLDFAFSLAMGEKPGRAAAKAIGSTIGAGLGTLVPIPFAGTILGGILGDIVGGALYDTFAGNEKPTAKAEGGRVSGGQSTVAKSRRIRTRKKAKVKRIQPQKTQPGKDIGGKQKIEQLYGVDEPGQRSALRALKDSSADVKRMKVLGGLPGAMFGAGIDLTLGQKPDKNLSRDLGNIFGSVIQSAVDAEVNAGFFDITKSLRMVSGGVVPSRQIETEVSLGEKIGKKIASTFTVAIESASLSIFKNLNDQLRLEGGGAGFDGAGFDGATYQLGEGAGGSQELREEVAKAAQQLGIPAPDLLGVILAESGGDPSRTNDWGCTGLIQFCPGTGQVTVGKTGAQLRRMSIREQMPYVVKYLKAAGVKPGMSGYDVYSAIHAGHPGGNVTDAAGVTTRGYYNSRVKGLIEQAKANSTVKATPTGEINSKIFKAAKMMKGMSSASGPGGGNVSCVWAVNKVFAKAGVPTPWGGALSTDQVIYGMQNKGWQRVSTQNARPGDVWVYDANDGRRGHVGIMMDNGKVLSNSSSAAKFTWEATPGELLRVYPASGMTPAGGAFYRAPGAPKPPSDTAKTKSQQRASLPTSFNIASASLGGSTGLNPIEKKPNAQIGTSTPKEVNSLQQTPSYASSYAQGTKEVTSFVLPLVLTG